MSSYRRLRWLVVAALFVQFAVGLGSELPPRREWFPFASWFLFVLVPNRTVECDVEIRAVDDQPLDPPQRFSRTQGMVYLPHSIAAFNVIQGLGQALRSGDAARARAARAQLESLCGTRRLRYDVVENTYDPVPRYDTGATLRRRVLGSFTTHEP